MTTNRQFSDDEGKFTSWQVASQPCRHCRHEPVMYRVWESSDGGYEDYQYQCSLCKRIWWIDGIDS